LINGLVDNLDEWMNGFVDEWIDDQARVWPLGHKSNNPLIHSSNNPLVILGVVCDGRWCRSRE